MPAGDILISQVLISAMFSMVGVLAAACAVQAIVRMRQEEAGRTAELILATPVSRVRWMRDYLALGSLGVVLVLLSGAVVSAASVLVSGDVPERVADSFIAAAVQLPAALAYLAVLALVFVLLPEMTAAVWWSLMGLGAFLGIFGGLIGAPEALRSLSPFTHTPIPAGAETDISGGLWMLAVAAAAVTAALACMRRRGLHAT